MVLCNTNGVILELIQFFILFYFMENSLSGAPSRSSHVLIITLLIVSFLATLILGGMSYSLLRSIQSSSRAVDLTPVNSRLDTLQQQVSSLAQSQNQSAQAVGTSVADLQPVVAYIHPELLTTQDRAVLQTKLIAPVTDFYNETAKNVVSILITVPQKAKDSFDTVIIMKDGRTDTFGYGSKGVDTYWWVPDCLTTDNCHFTQTFKAKYPDIVKGYQGN